MAMSVGPSSEDDGVMSDINTTPLVDVMLVLLIIFLITVPAVLQTVPLTLPEKTTPGGSRLLVISATVSGRRMRAPCHWPPSWSMWRKVS